MWCACSANDMEGESLSPRERFERDSSAPAAAPAMVAAAALDSGAVDWFTGAEAAVGLVLLVAVARRSSSSSEPPMLVSDKDADESNEEVEEFKEVTLALDAWLFCGWDGVAKAVVLAAAAMPMLCSDGEAAPMLLCDLLRDMGWDEGTSVIGVAARPAAAAAGAGVPLEVTRLSISAKMTFARLMASRSSGSMAAAAPSSPLTFGRRCCTAVTSAALMPSCNRLQWVLSPDLSLKVLWHPIAGQTNGFSPVCLR